MQTTIQQQLIEAGYVTSPNNIYSLPGSIWYAGGPGIPEPKYPHKVQVLDDRIRVFHAQLWGQPYTRQTYHDTLTDAVFDNVADFLAWCMEHGQQSQPGLPAFANSWD